MEKISRYLAYFVFALILIIHTALILVNILSSIYGREKYGVDESMYIISLIMSLLFTLLMVGWQYDTQKILEKRLRMKNNLFPGTRPN